MRSAERSPTLHLTGALESGWDISVPPMVHRVSNRQPKMGDVARPRRRCARLAERAWHRQLRFQTAAANPVQRNGGALFDLGARRSQQLNRKRSGTRRLRGFRNPDRGLRLACRSLQIYHPPRVAMLPTGPRALNTDALTAYRLSA